MSYRKNFALIDWSKEIVIERKDRAPARRSDLPCPYLASDTMEPVQSMVDGQFYSSKAKMRASYKAAGVVEVGNDPARLKQQPKPASDRKAIRKSIEKAFEMHASGVRPTS